MIWPGSDEEANRSSFLIHNGDAAAEEDYDDDGDSYKYIKCENCRSSFSMKQYSYFNTVILYSVAEMNNKTKREIQLIKYILIECRWG